MKHAPILIAQLLLLLQVVACSSTPQPESGTYIAESFDLGFGGTDRLWETERHPTGSVVRVSKSGWPGPMPINPDGGFERKAFADLAWQRGFCWWQLEQERVVAWNRTATPRTWTMEYVLSFSDRNVGAEQPSYPINMLAHGPARQAERLPSSDGEYKAWARAGGQ